MQKVIMFMLGSLAIILFAGSPCSASDLEDGISKYTDDSISKIDELGDPGLNIRYIITKAKSQADMARHKGRKATDGAEGQAEKATLGIGAMNSVVLGPGGTVKGDIIIIDQSRGDKTQVVE